jgi:regulator of protease activity HflC (stomatin/prohibitin superfamily)
LYEKVNELFVKVGVGYTEKVIEPAVNEAVKAAAAHFPVEQIIVNREQLKEGIVTSLSKVLANYHIHLESVNLVDIDFSEQFNHVVEQKQVEEQKIKTAEYQRMQAEEYKKKSILEAEAEAEKQRLLKQSVTADIVALEWIKKWNGQLPQTVLGEKSMMMLPGKDK